jgi:hypothetical protein
MYAIVQFVQIPGEPPITVPGDTIIVRQDKTAVAVVRDQKIQITPVEIGRDYGPSVEVTSGLNEGDLVVTSVTDAVQQGVRVVAKQSQETQAEGGQKDQIPNAGPNHYGDQSTVNSQSESTNQRGKSAQGQGGGQQGNQKNGNQSGGQNGQNQKTKEKQRKEMKKQQSGSSIELLHCGTSTAPCCLGDVRCIRLHQLRAAE